MLRKKIINNKTEIKILILGFSENADGERGAYVVPEQELGDEIGLSSLCGDNGRGEESESCSQR